MQQLLPFRLWFCVLAVLVGMTLTDSATARVFAPMCALEAASVVAPIPVLPTEHGEMSALPCEDAESPNAAASLRNWPMPGPDAARIRSLSRLSLLVQPEVLSFGYSGSVSVLGVVEHLAAATGVRDSVFRPPIS